MGLVSLRKVVKPACYTPLAHGISFLRAWARGVLSYSYAMTTLSEYVFPRLHRGRLL